MLLVRKENVHDVRFCSFFCEAALKTQAAKLQAGRLSCGAQQRWKTGGKQIVCFPLLF